MSSYTGINTIDGSLPERDLIQGLIDGIEDRGVIHVLTRGELDEVLRDVATEAEISDYLQKTTHFAMDDGVDWKWTTIPQPGQNDFDKDLSEPYQTVIHDVLQIFGVDYSATRQIVMRSSEPVHPKSTVQATPLLSICAVDDECFLPAIPSSGFEYATCATPIVIRSRGDASNEIGTKERNEMHLAQCIYYAEKIFHAQPGRRFVLVPLFTQSHVQIYRIDQGGAIHGELINIHEEPHLFVKIILFTCGQPSVQLGLHPSMTWTGEQLFISVEDLRYLVKDPVYIVDRDHGGPCRIWRAVAFRDGEEKIDESGTDVIIKWSWAEVSETGSECDMMNRVKGLQGVVQILAHGEQYHMFAGRGFQPEHGGLFDGIDFVENLIVMERYGDSLETFETPLEFLGAFRDAIAAHQRMWHAGVLHRDINFGNILLGGPNAKEGSRGVIIDLDNSVFIDAGGHPPLSDDTVGTRAFQSLKVSQSEDPCDERRHDYLDDLESFLWVFVWITSAYEVVVNGKARLIEVTHDTNESSDTNRLLRDLCSRSKKKHGAVRQRIFENPETVDLHPSYPAQFKTLMTKMIQFINRAITQEKMTGLADRHYTELLGYVDEAIRGLQPTPPIPVGNGRKTIRLRPRYRSPYTPPPPETDDSVVDPISTPAVNATRTTPVQHRSPCTPPPGENESVVDPTLVQPRTPLAAIENITDSVPAASENPIRQSDRLKRKREGENENEEVPVVDNTEATDDPVDDDTEQKPFRIIDSEYHLKKKAKVE